MQQIQQFPVVQEYSKLAVQEPVGQGDEQNDKTPTSFEPATELPSVEVLAKKVLQFQVDLWKENGRTPFEESYLEAKTKSYCEIEELIRRDEKKIPTWQLIGPLHYGMSLEKMKQVIIEKFKSMILSKTMMTEATKKIRHDPKTLFLTRDRNNLTRIWGAEFLKSNLPNKSPLDVTEHYLIIDDDAKEIEAEIFHGDYPYLSRVNITGYIVSKKIEGKKNALAFAGCSILEKLRYSDFSDEGNILQDSTKKNWIVDTEQKSFEKPELEDEAYNIQEYVKLRFRYLCGKDYMRNFQRIKISLSDIGIDK